MDEKPEPPAEHDCSGFRAPPMHTGDALRADILDPNSLINPNDRRQFIGMVDGLVALLAKESILGELRVEIVDDDRMSEMHERHKGILGTTDVLTFDLAPENAKLLDVDVLICADEAHRQSQVRSHTVVSELMLYIVHAVLHCTGFDDQNEDGPFGSESMHAREDEILRELGLGSVFHTRTSEDSS